MTEKLAEVRRILDRYIVEVVEAFDLCPWARSARLGGEVGIEVLWGEPEMAEWVEAARALLANPQTRVAMIVAPESVVTSSELRLARDRVTSGVKGTGVAHFHPEAELDLASPGRLVPFLRRSPDPLLQVVPLALLENVRMPPPSADRVRQVQMLGGVAPVMGDDIADMLAEVNHARVKAETDAVVGALQSIADDRRASYARVGIRSSR